MWKKTENSVVYKIRNSYAIRLVPTCWKKKTQMHMCINGFQNIN